MNAKIFWKNLNKFAGIGHLDFLKHNFVRFDMKLGNLLNHEKHEYSEGFVRDSFLVRHY